MRNDTVQGRSLTDEKAYEENVKLAREVADVLRKNIVQARRVEGASGTPDDETWSTSEYHDCMCIPAPNIIFQKSA